MSNEKKSADMPIALVTGASRGIGRSVAKAFGLKGWKVCINYNQSEKQAISLMDEIQQRGGVAQCFQCDVSQGESVKEMFDEIRRVFGGDPSVLVNNAGISKIKLFTDFSEEEWDRMFDVNVKGMFHCCQQALPSMISNKSGRIINISSIWGQTGASCEVAYSATKAAVIGFTKALAKEVGPSGITVNCVAPGVIQTEMNGELNEEVIAALKEETPLGRFGSPEDVANAVLFLSSLEAGFITGQVISPNGGYVI